MLLPASALFLGRPMPPARALVDAGAAVALATDFNPGSAFCESLPLVCSLAATQLKLSPAEALAACTVNAAHVLGRADRKGRIAPGYDADLVLLDAPDWRYLAYHLGHDHVVTVIVGQGGATLAAMPTRKQKRRRQKDRRHEYEYVYVDEEGQEVEVDEAEAANATPAKAVKAPAKGNPKSGGRAQREPPEPSWSRSIRRAVPWQIGILVLIVVVLRNSPLISRLLVAILYGALFVPLMYMTDRMVRNRWLKQQGKQPTKDKRHQDPSLDSPQDDPRRRPLRARPDRDELLRRPGRARRPRGGRLRPRRRRDQPQTRDRPDGRDRRRDPRHPHALRPHRGRRRPRRGDRRARLRLRGRGARARAAGRLLPRPPDPPVEGRGAARGRRDDRPRRDLSFETVQVPGHSPGHLAFYADGALFSGDVLFAGSVGRTDLPMASWDTLVESIRALVDRFPPETVVYSGHGPPTTLGAELARNPFLAELRA